MNALIHLTSRNNKLFRRDRTLLLLSLLAVLIVILLNTVFLKQTQLNAIEEMIGLSPSVESMINEWMVAGLLSITAFTTTLGAFGIMIRDKESKKTHDFLTAPLSRSTIQFSYVINAFIIGFASTLLAFIACEMFLVITGSNLLSFLESLQIIGIITLTVALSSAINLFLVLFINTQNSFSTLSTIVGTVIGFLCGVYIPVGVLPTYVQQIIMYFPVSHTSVLFRQVFMADSIDKVFEGAPSEVLLEYQRNTGVIYELNSVTLSNSISVGFIITATIVFAVISILLFKRKNK
nr:ABC transporter permease [Lysinibacillus timonensis]